MSTDNYRAFYLGSEGEARKLAVDIYNHLLKSETGHVGLVLSKGISEVLEVLHQIVLVLNGLALSGEVWGSSARSGRDGVSVFQIAKSQAK